MRKLRRRGKGEHLFLDTANWRRAKTIEGSDDQRHKIAAHRLEALSETVDGIDPDWLLVLWEFVDDDRFDPDEPNAENLNSLMYEIGFSAWHPKDASEFVARFIRESAGS